MRRIEKNIEEFISNEPLPSVAPDDPVTAAMEAMKACRSDCTLVIKEDKLVGIFTERDFLNRMSAEPSNPAETPIHAVMTKDPETLRRTDSVSYAINRMVVRGFRNIPIVDDKGNAVAVLDVRDVMNHISKVFEGVTQGKIDDSEWEEWTDIGGG